MTSFYIGTWTAHTIRHLFFYIFPKNYLFVLFGYLPYFDYYDLCKGLGDLFQRHNNIIFKKGDIDEELNEWIKESDEIFEKYGPWQSGQDMKLTFEYLYDKYNEYVMSIAHSILNDDELAKDAFQETFVSVAQNIDTIDDNPHKAKSFIKKTAKYVFWN